MTLVGEHDLLSDRLATHPEALLQAKKTGHVVKPRIGNCLIIIRPVFIIGFQQVPLSTVKGEPLTAKDYLTAEFHQQTWNRYLMLGLPRLIFHAMLCQTMSYDGKLMYYAASWCFHPPAHLATFAAGNAH